jgi:hypothetical protein
MLVADKSYERQENNRLLHWNWGGMFVNIVVYNKASSTCTNMSVLEGSSLQIDVRLGCCWERGKRL